VGGARVVIGRREDVVALCAESREQQQDRAAGGQACFPALLYPHQNTPPTLAHAAGKRISMPVLVAPMAMHGLAHPDKEPATARAAAAKGVPMVRIEGAL